MAKLSGAVLTSALDISSSDFSSLWLLITVRIGVWAAGPKLAFQLPAVGFFGPRAPRQCRAASAG
eukprot:SAG11_NODE_4256_length_1984_cov_1.211141_4_plen_65_part_00